MENCVVLKNPDQPYWEDMVRHVVLEEGWISSVHDYAASKKAFPDANFTFLVAVNKESGEFVGSICVSTFTDPEPISAIGMYAIKKECRGKGIGGYLFDRAMEISAPRKFLFGEQKMREKYSQKYGFNKIPDWCLIIGRVEIQKVKPHQLDHDPTLTVQSPAACGWGEIFNYYREILPKINGKNLIKAWLTQEKVHCAVALTNQKQIVALVRVRECFNNELSIEPLFGNDPLAACTALRAALQQISNLHDFKILSIQFPTQNADVHKFMNQMTDGAFKADGMVSYPQFTHEIIEVPTHRIFAVSQNGALV